MEGFEDMRAFDANDRVQDRTSLRRGSVLGWRCFGEQLVDDIETGPFRYYYHVLWDDGRIDESVAEKNLMRIVDT
jgi:hypothetical protein